MKRCTHCGQQLSPGETLCPCCGEEEIRGRQIPQPAADEVVFVVCTTCRQWNQLPNEGDVRRAHCRVCGTPLVSEFTSGAQAAPPVDPPLGFHPDRRRRWIAGLAVMILVGVWLAGEWKLAEDQREWTRTFNAAEATHRAEVAAAESLARERSAAREAEHRRWLADPAVLSGAEAERTRDAEWARRVAQDPSMAITPLETNLLRMTQLGKDPAVATGAALAEVALLASPAGSRVEVTPAGDRFVIRVAFKMAELSTSESGAVTKHHSNDSMRREVRDISARVLEDLVNSCGTRGIERIQVTCNHTLRQTLMPSLANEEERRHIRDRAPIIMGRLYRVSLDPAKLPPMAAQRQISRSDLMRRMRVDYDGFDSLTISTDGDRRASPKDANTLLQF
jgi:hypothetical protein